MSTLMEMPSSSYPALRRWPRHKINVPIRVIVHQPAKTRIIEGRGVEVSEGGMAVFAGVELGVLDEVEVEFTEPFQGDPIRVTGVIRNRSGYTYGVEFVPDNARAEKMRRLLTMHAIS